MKKILQKEELMLLGWGKTYNDIQVDQWIDKIISQYKVYGYSYFLIKEIDEKTVIGLVGLLETVIRNENVLEIAYIIETNYQGKGFAVESVNALITYFAKEIEGRKVIAQFVPENNASKKTAEKLGMQFDFSYTRSYNDQIKKHNVYRFD